MATQCECGKSFILTLVCCFNTNAADILCLGNIVELGAQQTEHYSVVAFEYVQLEINMPGNLMFTYTSVLD